MAFNLLRLMVQPDYLKSIQS